MSGVLQRKITRIKRYEREKDRTAVEETEREQQASTSE
jgi:hypothetical protein